MVQGPTRTVRLAKDRLSPPPVLLFVKLPRSLERSLILRWFLLRVELAIPCFLMSLDTFGRAEAIHTFNATQRRPRQLLECFRTSWRH